jgi:predicted transcriptional regulator
MASNATRGIGVVEDFVTKLKSRMAVLKLKPVELAERAGVGYPYLYRVLKREQAPSMEWAEKVGSEVGLRISTEVVHKSRRKSS